MSTDPSERSTCSNPANRCHEAAAGISDRYLGHDSDGLGRCKVSSWQDSLNVL